MNHLKSASTAPMAYFTTRKAIITIASNLPEWWQAYARPRMADYAARCGAELVVIEPEVWEGMKSRQITAEYVAKYDRSLVLDADLLVSREAPNIFEQFPAGAVYMASDSEPSDPDAMRQWQLIVALQAICDSIGWTKGYHNTGVVLCDRKDSGLWSNWFDLPAHTCPDQANLNWKVRARRHPFNPDLGTNLVTIGREWNAFGLNSPDITNVVELRNVVTDELKRLERPHPSEVGYNHLSRVEDICHNAHIFHAAGFAEPERTEAMKLADQILP